MDYLREALKEQTSKELHKNKKMAYAKRKKQKIKEFGKPNQFDQLFATELRRNGSSKMLKALLNTCIIKSDLQEERK